MKDLTGIRKGRLTVLSYSRPLRNRHLWLVECDCGTRKEVLGNLFGRSFSCGCYTEEIRGTLRKTHGMSGTREYSSWSNMLTRCNNPSYKYYCGRGITVCERWRKFENFIADMGNCPPGFTIERINVNGNYEKGNCIWIAAGKQSSNRRNNILVDHDGSKVTITELARLSGVLPKTARDRYHRGWEPFLAATTKAWNR